MMRALRAFWIRLRHLFGNRRAEQDFSAEIESHLQLHIDDNLRAGMSPERARRDALIRLGGAEQVRQTYREREGLPWLETVCQDIRYGFRLMHRRPGFASVSILTLALGIGAVTSVFSVVDAVLLKPFAFHDPDRLVVLREAVEDAQSGKTAIPDNYRHFLRLKNTSKTLADAAIFAQRGSSVSVSGEHPQMVGEVTASPNIFQLLGISSMLGRGFVESDAARGANQVVVLSYAGWQTFFAGNPRAIGHTLMINGEPATVIGILPQWMRFPRIAAAPSIAFQESANSGRPYAALLFQPLIPTDRDLQKDMGGFDYKAIGRLKPGVTLAQANAELEALQNSYSLAAHLPFHFGIALTPLAQDVASPISGALWLLFAAVGAVLLIACVNLASLQLARAVNAEQETAVRAALGEGKLRLVRSRLTESLLLALIGGAAGAALAFATVRLFIGFVPANVPRLDEVRVSTPVLLFAAGISILAAITFGILPALRSLRVHPQAALQSASTRTAGSHESSRTRSLLVASQVACTVVLLIVTSLALRSFSHLMRVNRGFDTSHVTLAQVNLFAPQYGDVDNGTKIRRALVDRLLTALRRLPAVQSVAITSVAPLTGENWVDNIFRPDHPVRQGTEPAVNVRWIDPDYFPTMHSQLISGRNFTAADQANPDVALLSEKTAREAFPGEDPIGHKIINLVPDDQHPITIVGIVADAHINGLKDDAAVAYLPYWAFTPYTLSFLVRSSQPSGALIPELRHTIWKIDPQLPISTIKSMDDQLSDSVATDRFQALLLASFGVAALLLALLGIYGVLGYSVSLRRHEFGIRIALGSGKGALIRLVLRQAAYPVLLGTGAGLAMSAIVLRWVHSLLYQTPALDPFAIGGSVGLLLVAAGAAAIIPARRAASIDPMQALRTE